MLDLTRRAAILGLLGAGMAILVGCGDQEVVVGPNANGSKKHIKGREADAGTGRRGARKRGN